MSAARAGFTLIELLIVISILLLLMGMLLPMYGIIQRSTLRSRSEFVLKKVDTALRLFKTEWGAYPYQSSYPDMAPGSRFPNHLFYRIGTNISIGDRAKVVADMDAAGTLYAYQCTVKNVSGSFQITEPAQLSPFAFTYASAGVAFHDQFIAGTDFDYQGKNYGAMALLNQSAQEQARLAMVAGNIAMRGPLVCTDAATVAVNRTNQVLLPAAQSAGNPGMAVDYLKGDIDASCIGGDDILDAWRKPLVYICQSTPGMQGAGGAIWGFQVPGYDSRMMGLGALGFDPATGPGPALLSGRPLLLFSGRVRLSQHDAGDGLGATPTDAAAFPSTSNLQDSDVRYYAAPGYEKEFELWSGGPDKDFSYMRGAQANRDNVAILPYNRGL